MYKLRFVWLIPIKIISYTEKLYTGYGSVRMEDCYLITADGVKRMTTYNDEFIPQLFK